MDINQDKLDLLAKAAAQITENINADIKITHALIKAEKRAKNMFWFGMILGFVLCAVLTFLLRVIQLY